MKQDILKNTVEKLAEPVFRYCLKRLGNLEDAEDLSQDILLEIVKFCRKETSVRDTEHYLWKIVRNRYARRMAEQNAEPVFVGESDLEQFSDAKNADCFDALEQRESEEAVLKAVRSMAQLHREILVDFYIRELSYTEIARKYSLAPGTVKTRLHFGRQKLKERTVAVMNEKRTVIGKITWHIMCNGNMDPNRYLDRQVCRAICLAAYEKPMTEEEISEKTGVPCFVVEDELAELLYGEAIKREGNRLEANFILHTKQMRDDIVAVLKPAAEKIAPALTQLLAGREADIRRLGFEGSEFPRENLWWVMIPNILRTAVWKTKNDIKEAGNEDFPLRRDGGRGWFVVHECENGSLPFASGCNGYFIGENWDHAFEYFWTSSYFSNSLNRVLHCAGKMNFSHGLSLNGLPESDLALLIEAGLVEKEHDSYRWRILILSEQQKARLMGILAEIADNFVPLLTDAAKRILRIYTESVPTRLKGQISGVMGGEINSVVSIVLEKLVSAGTLRLPADNDLFVDQVWGLYR